MEVQEQDSILNELLNKIKLLEKSNESLKQKISKKKESILKLDTQNKEGNINIIIETQNIPTEKEDEVEAQKSLQYYKNMRYNNDISVNCIEYTIDYISYEHHNNLYIMGDFNKWELTPMKKNGDSFYFKVILLKGFKYYYAFQADEQIILDYDHEYEKNPKNNQIQNYVNLNKKNENNLFDTQNDFNILELSQKNFLLNKMDISEDDYYFLSKFKYHGVINKELNKKKRDKYYQSLDAINMYYREKSKYENPNFDKINRIFSLKIYLKNRILIRYSTNDKNKTPNLYYYKIHNLNDNNIAECIKLYDNNNIKIDENYYSLTNFYYTVLPSNISTKSITKESKFYHLLSYEESQKILNDYNNDEKGILKAYFKTLNNLKNNANMNIDNFDDNNNDNLYHRQNMIYVTPYKIEPEGINKEDYDFYYTPNFIKKVRNKKEGSSVKFKIIDESVLKKNKPNRYEIYYAVKNDKFQIIHIHIKDKDLSNIKLIIKEADKKVDYHDFKRNEEYIKNNILLLLIQDLKPFKLYYQGKKVKMEEVKIEENKLYLLQSSNPDSIFNSMYVKVTNIFNKINYDLMEQCNEQIYTLNDIENIQNSVDVEVNFDPDKNYVVEKMMLAVSPCLLKPISSYDENLLKQKMYNKDLNIGEINRESMTDLEKYFDICEKMVEYRKYDKNKINGMSPEEKDKLKFILNIYSKEMNSIMIYIQDNEMWESIDEAMIINGEITNLINLLNE